MVHGAAGEKGKNDGGRQTIGREIRGVRGRKKIVGPKFWADHFPHVRYYFSFPLLLFRGPLGMGFPFTLRSLHKKAPSCLWVSHGGVINPAILAVPALKVGGDSFGMAQLDR